MKTTRRQQQGSAVVDETAGRAPRVSVIMPFLNAEHFIGESIESVLGQTYPQWELLLVDDGSTDGSTEIARDYAAREPDRIRYLEHAGHANLGASASRNLALRHGRGEYVALLDADDVWLPEKLEQQVPMLDARPEVGSLYGNTLYWFSWEGRPDRPPDFCPRLGLLPHTVHHPPKLLVACLSGRAAVPCTCSILIRRSVVEQVGGFEDSFQRVFTDQVFYAKLFLASPVYVTDHCWDLYRQHADSACHVAKRDGEIAARRKAYLEWLEGYLAARGEAKGPVWEAVQDALWPFRHPHRDRVRQLVSRSVGRMKTAVKQPAKRILSPGRYERLASWSHRVIG